MNAFQRCPNTTDAIPLYLPQQLYLKPIARINISIQLTQKMMGKTITHYELMEKLRELIRPDEFTLLKVTKTTLEIIRFEAEVEHKNKIFRVISKLDNKMIKLKEFNDLMRVKSAESKLDFPNRHIWDSYFRDAKDMNEMKPGERPDTIHISNLPTKWFVPYHLRDEDQLLPSEKILYCIFEKFGSIRLVDIPICDPYRSKMKSHITGLQNSSFEETDFFEGYIQFKDYIGFAKAMDALKGMKLMHKEDGEAVTINIYVDFDKSKHLSEAAIRRRNIVRDRMILKDKDREAKEKQIEDEKNKKEMADRQKQLEIRNEKETRRREREEKRKAKILAELKVKGSDDISEKIAREEKKLLKVQRRLEAIRLVEELFKRIKTKLDKDRPVIKTNKLKTNEPSLLKLVTEQEVKSQREKLHHAIEGRLILKSIIANQAQGDSDDSSSASSTYENKIMEQNRIAVEPVYQPQIDDMNWYGYQQMYNNIPQYYRDFSRGFPYYPQRGRGTPGPSRRPQRGFNRGRGRGMNHYIHQEYYKYAQQYLKDHMQQHFSRHIDNFSRSRSRSYSRHRTRSRSRSRSRTRSRSYSRSHSRHRSKSSRRSRRSISSKRSRRSRSESSRMSRSRSRRGSRSRSKRLSRSRSRSKKRSHSKTSRSRSKSGGKD